jgi:hypothetical protein
MVKNKMITYGPGDVSDISWAHVPASPSFPRCRPDTHNPPYEQLFVGVGWVPCRSAVVFRPPLLTPAVNGTRHPPYEQLLVGVGVGAVVLGVCCSSPLLASLSFHPRPTPRAVAREAGGGWCGVVRRRPPSLPAARRRHGHSTRDPPHEQLLVGLGAGGVSPIVWCWSLVVVPVVPIGGGGVTQAVAPEPPREQVLAAVGGGCWCSPSLVSLAPRHGTHPQTTLRAAAHRRGGGRRVVPGCWGPHRHPSVVVVVVVAVSTHDPTCEQSLAAGGRVLARLGVVLVVVVVVVALSW